MPTNLELKTQLKNFEQVVHLLKNIGAEYSGILNQKDIYYKVSNGLLKLRLVNGKQELIKYTRHEGNSDRFSDYEVLIISTPGVEDFFRNVFEVQTIVEKKRTLYMFKNTRIHLDEVKELGNFLELETLVLNGKEDAVSQFNELVDLLHLDLTKQIKTSYKNLIDERREME